MEPHWQFLIEHEKGIRAICNRAAYGKGPASGGRNELADDLYSICCERIPGIFATWDMGKGASIKTHVFINLSWYVWKWVKRKGRPISDRNQQTIPDGFDVEEVDTSIALDRADEVNTILQGLAQYDRLVLMLYYFQGSTFKEIAEVLGVSKGTARNHYIAALRKAKDVANAGK